ncbi:ABC transporter substrate-binding protein, partial [Cellulomonas bogoriensis 69B4 = DSM 16987]
GGTSPTVPAPDLVVHVVGAVHAPGLVTVPRGSRVADAVAEAGGPTDAADLAALNLAREVLDGEQLRVPVPGEVVEPGPEVAGPGAPVSGTLVDVNRADVSVLETLPGIGPVMAARIVEHRTARPFTSVDELIEVTGIGPKVLAGIRDLVTV